MIPPQVVELEVAGLKEALRTRVRRAVDLVILGFASLAAVLQLVDLAAGGRDDLPSVAITVALALCALVGVTRRARWTPVAYIVLILTASILYMRSYGPGIGLGTIYSFTVTLAFVFLSPRWRWLVFTALLAVPIGIGVLLATHVLGPAPVFALADRHIWILATTASVGPMIAIALMVRLDVRQLEVATLEVERARLYEREASRERERVEGEIERARRSELIVELAAEVGADIGAALAVVTARATALAQELTSEAARSCLADVVTAATTAGSTMHSLTLFNAEIGTGEVESDATRTVRELPRAVGRMLPTRIALRIAGDVPPAWVAVSAVDLLRVLTNLVINARDAISGEGTIDVRVTHDDARITVVVEDDGAGMDDATLARIFQPFFTTKPVGRGTGLGLATARILLERAGGAISVTSAVGLGTRFTITLPRLDMPDEPQSPGASPERG